MCLYIYILCVCVCVRAFHLVYVVRERAPPSQESIPPPQERAPPSQESVPPPQERAPPSQESVPPPHLLISSTGICHWFCKGQVSVLFIKRHRLLTVNMLDLSTKRGANFSCISNSWDGIGPSNSCWAT